MYNLDYYNCLSYQKNIEIASVYFKPKILKNRIK